MRSFGYPLTTEHALEFCRPDPRGAFCAPFRWGEDFGAANGVVAIRIESYIEGAQDSPEAVARVAKLPWSAFPGLAKDTKWWGALDDRRAAIWKRGELDYWDRTATRGSRRVTEPRVGIGKSCMTIPLPLLQLIAKLPKVEVYTGPANYLYFRFRGGQGIAVPFPRHDRGDAIFALYGPAFHRLD